MFFFLVCVAVAAAAPQWVAGWPGYLGHGLVAPLGARTLVAGPTVVNGYPGVVGGRLIAPGYVGHVW